MTCAPPSSAPEHAQTTTSGTVQRLHAWPAAMVQRLIWRYNAGILMEYPWGCNGMPRSSSGWWLTCPSETYMKVRDDSSHFLWKNKNVPNHQSVTNDDKQ